MSTTTQARKKTVELTDDQLEVINTDAKPIFNVVNHSHDDIKDHTYSVVANADGHATSCTCPHHTYRSAFCKHMAAVEESISESTDDDEERVTGPYTGYDCYGNVDHTYWRCESCNAEATRKSALADCC